MTLPDIERFLNERIPLQIPNFQVFLNGKQVTTRVISGKRFPVRCKTSCGEIRGEIIIPNLPPKGNLADEKGIECHVKEIFIKRETFGLEYSHSLGANRLMGKIYVDFLPITSDRSRFITDTPEYREFERLMRQELQLILKEIKVQVGDKEEKKADTVLKDALSHIRKALKKHPEFAPETQAPIPDNREDQISLEDLIEKEDQEYQSALSKENALSQPTQVGGAEQSENLSETDELKVTTQDEEVSSEKMKNQKVDRSSAKIKVKTLNGKEVMARRMKIGTFSIVCRTEQLGENESPVIQDGGIIFINRDHCLYKRFIKNAEALTLLITQLIAQEVARMRTHSPSDAFLLQNQLLEDAWG